MWATTCAIEFSARGYTSFHRVRKRYPFSERKRDPAWPPSTSESEFLAGVHTTTAVCSLSPSLSSSLSLSVSVRLLPPCIQRVLTRALSSLLPYIRIQMHHNPSSFLHNVVALVASLSRFLFHAFPSQFVPTSILFASSLLRFVYTLYGFVFLSFSCLFVFSFTPFLSQFLHLSFVLVPWSRLSFENRTSARVPRTFFLMKTPNSHSLTRARDTDQASTRAVF